MPLRYKLFDQHFKGAKTYEISDNDGGVLKLDVDGEGYFEVPRLPSNIPLHAFARLISGTEDPE